MKLVINEEEILEAVVDWLKKKHKIEVSVGQLEPLTKTESDYDRSSTYQIGYQLEYPKGE